MTCLICKVRIGLGEIMNHITNMYKVTLNRNEASGMSTSSTADG